MDGEPFITACDLARSLHVSDSTPSRWRSHGAPCFIIPYGDYSLIRYRLSEIIAWRGARKILAANKVRSSAKKGGAASRNCPVHQDPVILIQSRCPSSECGTVRLWVRKSLSDQLRCPICQERLLIRSVSSVDEYLDSQIYSAATDKLISALFPSDDRSTNGVYAR